ncbi:MAG: Zn-dependent M28 family amino/carboxypeptidase [Paraglaciecola sp.]|jgi:Zn-dependent M28 family amino/carboxypeptidase
MRTYFYLVLISCSLLLAGCQNSTNEVKHQQKTASKADPQQLKAHIRFLSDDLLEGRDLGSKGHEIASKYIAAEFEKFALQPAGDNGSYLQRINFRQAFIEQSSPSLKLTTANGEVDLSYPKHYTTSASPVREQANLNGQLIFAGYGIIAPELNHNDYLGLDVKGKVVVVLSGKPSSFPSEEGAHFGSSSEKKRHAVENGAIGYISVSTPTAEKVRPYQNLLNYLHMPRVRWLDEYGEAANVFPQLQNSAYFSKEAAQILFADAKLNLEQIYQMLEEDQSPEGFDLPVSISFSKRSQHKTITSPNVVAILEGSDPKLRQEYVVFSAHSDHIGLAKTVKKDKINNGAMDNASGTAVLIETARMFSQMQQAPKRSILFVAVTGEEKGLLGSDYYAQNPTVPKGYMVANVNLDMPILTYEFTDVIAFGANHSDLKLSVAGAAEKINLTLSPDPWPEQALFTRSDHYSFVKQGIPSVFIVPGMQSADPLIDGSKQFGHFIQNNYHKPGDDFSQAFNWQAATKFTEVNYHIGLTIAEQLTRPDWNEGDFFGDTFSQ